MKVSFSVTISLTLPICMLAACSGGDRPGGSGGTSTADDTAADPEDWTFVDCDEPLPGIPWGDTVDGSVGWEEGSLDDFDPSELPEEIDLSQIEDHYLAQLGFALREDLGETVSRDEVLAKGELGLVVLAAIFNERGSNAGIDYDIFEKGLTRYYTCSLGLPSSLVGFREVVFDYSVHSSEDIDSNNHCGKVRVTRDLEAGFIVSETLLHAGTDDEAVRETEILMLNERDDGAMDFLVYGPYGWLTDRTTIDYNEGTADDYIGASPAWCMNCHYDSEDMSYDVISPTDHGYCSR